MQRLFDLFSHYRRDLVPVFNHPRVIDYMVRVGVPTDYYGLKRIYSARGLFCAHFIIRGIDLVTSSQKFVLV